MTHTRANFLTRANIAWLTFLAVALLVSPVVAQTGTSTSDKASGIANPGSQQALGRESETADADKSAADVPAALNFTMKSIDGEGINLLKYKGNVVMFVNVASKCGNTPQYKQLQMLHEQYGEKGLSIVGVPCNQFGGQEPGTEAEIAEFCQKNYGVEFDMLAKVDVKDNTKCDLYAHLTSLDLAPAGAGDVAWNFEKFILDRQGEPIGRYGSKVKPADKDIVNVIKTALAEKIGTHYSHVSEKLGRTYYLFKKETRLKNSDKVQTIYFFAKDPNNKKGTPLASVPEDRKVSETKTGMLVLKKKN